MSADVKPGPQLEVVLEDTEKALALRGREKALAPRGVKEEPEQD